MKACAIVGLLMLLAIGLLGENVDAEDGSFALAAKAGTLGFGLEGIARLNSRLNAKAGVNAFEYDYDDTESDVEYALELELLTFSLLLDWFPFENPFRISAGLLINQNGLNLNAKSTATYTIGEDTYSLAEVGSLNGELDFNDAAPYIGIGLGNPFGSEGNWSFAVDAGVMFQGSPDVDLSADGTLANNASFLADLAREEENLQSEIDEYDMYPVISVGISYRF